MSFSCDPVRNTNVPTVGDYDHNTQVEDLENAAQEAAAILTQEGPNGITPGAAANFMTAINNLNAYFTANPPPPGTNSAAMQTALNQLINPLGTLTIAQFCAQYPATPGTMDQLVKVCQMAPGPISALYTALYQSNNAENDQNLPGITKVQGDIEDLILHLKAYTADVLAGKSVTNDLSDIASIISNLSTDATDVGITDGWLTTLISQIKSPTSSTTSSSSLLDLCTAVLSSKPPSAASLTNLQTALNNLGENLSGGGTLTELFSYTMSKEDFPS